MRENYKVIAQINILRTRMSFENPSFEKAF